MDMLFVVLSITAVFSGCFLAWTYTKSGEKWMASL